MLNEVDVLVVGGGPSGMTVAAEVARAGARTLVVEKRSVAPVPRAGTILPRPLELFDARGIAGRFIERTAKFSPVPFQSSHIWGGMHPVDWSSRESRFGFTLFLSQHEAELILQEWAGELGVQTSYETELIGLTRESEGVTAVVRDSSGTDHSIRASYIVGADGGRSTTRELAGIEWVGRDATFTGFVATADMEFPWEGGLRVGHNTLGWGTSFRFGEGQTRFTIVHKDSMSKPQAEPVTIEEVERSIRDVFGDQITVPSLVSATRYGDARRVATKLIDGRVILVGESARVHYPASGVGMNFCIQDAFNIGWKLGAVVAGAAGVSLLETYETERRPVIDDLLASVDAQVGAQFNFTDEGLAFLDYFSHRLMTEPDVTATLQADLNGLLTAYPSAQDHPSVGLPIPDFELLLRDGQGHRVYELLRDETFLVLDLTGAQSVQAEEIAGLPARIVAGFPTRLPSALRDASVVVIRPDTYIAWIGQGNVEGGRVRAALKEALHLSA